MIVPERAKETTVWSILASYMSCIDCTIKVYTVYSIWSKGWEVFDECLFSALLSTTWLRSVGATMFQWCGTLQQQANNTQGHCHWHFRLYIKNIDWSEKERRHVVIIYRIIPENQFRGKSATGQGKRETLTVQTELLFSTFGVFFPFISYMFQQEGNEITCFQVEKFFKNIFILF